MISIFELLSKHGSLTHGHLNVHDLNKSMKSIDKNKKLGDGEKTVYPSSRSKTGLKRYHIKLNNIKRRKV
jgi:hypothetical protein